MDQSTGIEIAGYRDPDGEITLTVFYNGEPVTGIREGIVDPGASSPYPLSVWRRNVFEVARCGGSPAWIRQMIEFYYFAEERYTKDDMTPARDMQPGVSDPSELVPALWINTAHDEDGDEPHDTGHDEDGNEDEGEDEEALDTGRLTGDLEHDNTVHAGWALAAVLATWQLLRSGADLLTIAHAALRAYVEIADEIANDAETVVLDLLAGLRHLADAKSEDLDMPPGDNESYLLTLMRTLTTALAAQWEQSVHDRTWLDAESDAFDLYTDQVTGNA